MPSKNNNTGQKSQQSVYTAAQMAQTHLYGANAKQARKLPKPKSLGLTEIKFRNNSPLISFLLRFGMILKIIMFENDRKLGVYMATSTKMLATYYNVRWMHGWQNIDLYVMKSFSPFNEAIHDFYMDEGFLTTREKLTLILDFGKKIGVIHEDHKDLYENKSMVYPIHLIQIGK